MPTMSSLSMGTLIVCLFFLSSLHAHKKDQKPNFLFILSDDLGYNDVGFIREEDDRLVIPTPNIDELAYGGARFDHQYVQPLCSPTRASLMTGRFPFRNGFQRGVVRPTSAYGLPLEDTTVAEELRRYGYKNYLIGKWHLGYYKKDLIPVARGFDYQYGSYMSVSHVNHNKSFAGFFGENWATDHAATQDQPQSSVYENKRYPLYSSADLALEAKEVFENHDQKTPFHMHLSFLAPHTPLEVDPAGADECGDGRFAEGRRIVYCTMVSGMDAAIGQVVQSLKDTGLYDNTIIIYMSDNGGIIPQGSNYPLRGQKLSLFEGGVRTPMFVHNPSRIAPQSEVKTGMIHSVDWFSTLIAVARNEKRAANPGFTSFAAFNEEQDKEEGERTVGCSKKDVDGMNVWPYIVGKKKESPRDNVVINIDNEIAPGAPNHSALVFTYRSRPWDKCHAGSLDDHVFKYFAGHPGGPPGLPGVFGELACWGGKGLGIWTGGGPEGCLFPLSGSFEGLVDLTVDPEERVNLLLGEEEGKSSWWGKKDPSYNCIAEIGREMLARYAKGEVPALYTNQADPQSNPELRGGWWSPWEQ